MSRSNSRLLRALTPLAVLLAVLAVPVDAQQTGTLQGTVVEAATSRPLVGAQVSVPSLRLGSITNATGRFQLVNVPAGTHQVRVQLLGHGTVTREVVVTAGSATTVNFELEASAIQLDELVVTGTIGPTQRAKVPFEVASVTERDLQVPATTAGGAIQGKIAGARVVQTSGSPGSAPEILLRGPTSINAQGRGQEPLYIVDGVILAGGLASIDAQDIERVEVVKGAAAASLYGSRAAAGVVQITTRRGRAAEGRTRYTFRTQYGMNSIAGSNPLSQNHRFRLSADGNRFLCTDPSNVARGEFACDWNDAQYTLIPDRRIADPNRQQDFVTFQDKPFPGVTYNQVERVFDPGTYLQNFAGIEGSSGDINFYASFGNLDESGVVAGHNGYQRQNFRINLDHGRTGPFQIAANAFYSQSRRDVLDSRAVFQSLSHQMPNVDLLARDSITGELVIQPNPRDTEYQNPLYAVERHENFSDGERLNGGLVLRYAPVTWGNIEGNLSYDRTNSQGTSYYPRGYQTILPGALNEGQYYRSASQNDALNTSITGTLTRQFGELTSRVQGRYLYEQANFDFFSAQDARLPVADLPRLGIGIGNQTVGSSQTEVRAEGWFVIGNLDFRDRYILDGLVRRDGSSLFGADERWQTYYRLSGAYRMAEEEWWPLDAVNEFKLRYSHGTAGGRPNFAAQYETYSIGSGGSVTPATLGNRNLRPEFVTEREGGIEMGLFDRAYLNLTYAHSVAEDQILPVPLLSYAGFTSQWQNAGTLESRTFEASLEAPIVRTRNLNWTSRLLFDRTRQEITRLDVPCYRNTGYTGAAGQGIETAFYTCEGEALGTFYGVKFAQGLDDLPEAMRNNADMFQINDDGYLVYVGQGNTYRQGLANNLWGTTSGSLVNPVTNQAYNWGMPIVAQGVDSRTGEPTTLLPLGSTTPKFNLSFSNNLDFRGFNVYGLLDGSFGFNIYNQQAQWSLFNYRGGQMDQVDKEDELKKPVAYYMTAGLYNALGPNSHFVEDGSFVKLRELAVRYTFNRDQLARFPMGGMDRVTFGLVGRNLLTWTQYSGYDPEVGHSGGASRTGSAIIDRFDRYGYPGFRTLSASIEIGF
jgi:TonB-linked SusC/RagA family outer membrane protein